MFIRTAGQLIYIARSVGSWHLFVRFRELYVDRAKGRSWTGSDLSGVRPVIIGDLSHSLRRVHAVPTRARGCMTPFLDLLHELPAAADDSREGKESETSAELIDVRKRSQRACHAK